MLFCIICLFQVVGVAHREGCYGVEYVHHLLETLHVPSAPLPHLGGAGEPSVFLATRSLVQLDEQSLLSNISHSIPGKWVWLVSVVMWLIYCTVAVSRMLLKRKVQ